MPAATKNSRGGAKRSGSSAVSSYMPSMTLAVFVGFCLFGVYKLSSSRTGNSSIINSHHKPHKPHQRVQLPPRSVLRDQTSAYSATEDEMPEDAVARGESEDAARRENTSSGESEDSQEAQPQQQDEEQSQSEDQQQSGEQTSEEQQQQNGERSNEEQTASNQDEAAVNESEQQQQQSESNQDGSQQQQSQEESTDVIEQVTVGEGGVTSQSQLEHDSDGTTEQQQQQQQEEEDQRQQPKEEQQKEQQQEEQEEMRREPKDELQQDEQQKEQQEEEQQQKEKLEETVSAKQESVKEESEENPNASEFTDGGDSSTERKENTGDTSKTWKTQAAESTKEKERRKGKETEEGSGGEGEGGGNETGDEWALCNVTAGADYIPCLDNEKAIKQLHSLRHYEHRERHCPEEGPTCLVPLPTGYKHSLPWPQSRDKIWYSNVPHAKLAEVKGHQNWVKVEGDYLTFPGGGTQFIHGALHYIDFIQQSVPEIAWGKRTRVILDVGCGVASFGGFLFERDVLAMSFAPKDEHEAQVQFALERGIPAISAVMGSQRLPFPSRVFDVVHCARCRVPWHANDGALLLELNRVLRPGGYFVWSATPVYQKLKEDVEIWEAMTALTKSMCWDLVTIKKDELNSVGAAMYKKPTSNECYEKRKQQAPPLCKEDDDPNAAWYVPLQSCMHRVPVVPTERGTQWPEKWPARLQTPPYWLNKTQTGIYGKPAPQDFSADYEHWQRVVQKSYLTGFGIDWSKVRNVMDMRAAYGGFAAALRDMKLWVMNLVNIDAPDTLPIIYERGLFGMYHDWCESFSTYPRTYDLLHADHLFSQVKKRCKVLPVIAEVDRIVRPGGKVIVRDESEVVSEVESLLKSLHWEIRLTFSKNGVGILCAEKSDWRPEKLAASS